MEPETRVGWPAFRFPPFDIDAQRHQFHILVVFGKQVKIVCARDDYLVVCWQPVNEALWQGVCFPHRKTRLVLVPVKVIDLEGLHHVDQNIGVFMQRDVGWCVVEEPFEH